VPYLPQGYEPVRSQVSIDAVAVQARGFHRECGQAALCLGRSRSEVRVIDGDTFDAQSHV
jgi:hypothetical protein